jgi:hypothetical protein
MTLSGEDIEGEVGDVVGWVRLVKMLSGREDRDGSRSCRTSDCVHKQDLRWG